MALLGLTYAMTKAEGWRTQIPSNSPISSLNGEQAIIRGCEVAVVNQAKQTLKDNVEGWDLSLNKNVHM